MSTKKRTPILTTILLQSIKGKEYEVDVFIGGKKVKGIKPVTITEVTLHNN